MESETPLIRALMGLRRVSLVKNELVRCFGIAKSVHLWKRLRLGSTAYTVEPL